MSAGITSSITSGSGLSKRSAEAPRKRVSGADWLTLAAVALLLIVGAVYLTQSIDHWLSYDDEGGYLYAGWRISLGEVPYRDFLTPQLPVFLYPVALILKLTGNSVHIARLYMSSLVLLTGALLAAVVWRIWGRWPALLCLVLYFPNAETFWAARFVRPEAPMLAWAAVAIALYVFSQERRWLLALSGAAMGLSMMSKLFGALPMAGLSLYLLLRGFQTRRWRQVISTGLWMALPFLVVVGGIGGYSLIRSPNFVADVLGHHVKQGSGMPMTQVLTKAMTLYAAFARQQALLLVLAAVGIGHSVGRRHGQGWLFVCMLPTALGFLVLTRDLQVRHLTYLVPYLTSLAAVGLWATGSALWKWKSTWWMAGLIAIVGAVAIYGVISPNLRQNALVASWDEDTTDDWASYIQQHTDRGAYVMSDYPGINFFAQRPTTPTAAGISRGAASSGQIMGSTLVAEIEAYDVKMVLLNVAHGSHQFVRLLDYGYFKRYVQDHFSLAERRQYGYRLMEIYAREDLFPGTTTLGNYAFQLELTGVRWLENAVPPQNSLQAELRWKALNRIPDDQQVTLTLRDLDGHLWAIGGKPLVDVDRDTYFDERGLERAVLLPTSHWPVGEATLETFELPVPAAVPPGQYQVGIRVHPEGAWSGLTLVDPETGLATGYEYPAGAVTILPPDRVVDVNTLDMGVAVDEKVDYGLKLLGYKLSASEAHPGDRITLTAYWQALSAVDADILIEAYLKSPTAVIAGSHGDVANGYPTSLWREGDVFAGQYDLLLDRTADPGTYDICIGLVRGKERTRPLILAPIEVTSVQRHFVGPNAQVEVVATAGGFAEIVGLRMPSEGTPGDILPVELVWRAKDETAISYTTFAHLVSGDGRVVAQYDGRPMSGEHPTTAWLPGEYITDRFDIAVPEGVPAGTYELMIGLYHAESARRATLVGGDGSPIPRGALRAATVDVSAP